MGGYGANDLEPICIAPVLEYTFKFTGKNLRVPSQTVLRKHFLKRSQRHQRGSNGGAALQIPALSRDIKCIQGPPAPIASQTLLQPTK